LFEKEDSNGDSAPSMEVETPVAVTEVKPPINETPVAPHPIPTIPVSISDLELSAPALKPIAVPNIGRPVLALKMLK